METRPARRRAHAALGREIRRRNPDADRCIMQEFSIEIPDKDADAIHSGKRLHLSFQSIRLEA